MKRIKKMLFMLYGAVLGFIPALVKVSAELEFNEAKAKEDTTRLLTPIFNWALAVVTIVAAGYILFQYLGWRVKDSDERPPFIKIVKTELIAYISVFVFRMILMWFNIL